MIDALVLTAALLVAPDPGSPSTTTTAPAASTAAPDRQWSVHRPTRGDSRGTRVIQRAATFPSSIIPKASCVIRRESGGNIHERQSGVRARNSGSSAQGRWQFINNDWQHSLPWHVRDRLVQFGMPKAEANKVRRFLDKRPIYQWNGWWQDIGFIETVVDRNGWKHWNGHGC
jgi:hypothetical protein